MNGRPLGTGAEGHGAEGHVVAEGHEAEGHGAAEGHEAEGHEKIAGVGGGGGWVAARLYLVCFPSRYRF